jgi:hypothetical protein
MRNHLFKFSVLAAVLSQSAFANLDTTMVASGRFNTPAVGQTTKLPWFVGRNLGVGPQDSAWTCGLPVQTIDRPAENEPSKKIETWFDNAQSSPQAAR